MQPDPFIPQREENHLEPLSPAEITPSEPPAAQEVILLEPAPVQDAVISLPSLRREKKPSKWNIAAIILGLFSLILLVAVTGLGYWAYTLNNVLVTTQQQLNTLQGEHRQLQAEHNNLKGINEKLNADLDQFKADLEKANTDLATRQADLKKSQDENRDLSNKIDSASKLAEVLYSFSNVEKATDVFAIDASINATNDKKLIALWNDFASTPSEKTSADLILYLVTSIRNDLK